jgi:ferredoxin-NADP reductase
MAGNPRPGPRRDRWRESDRCSADGVQCATVVARQCARTMARLAAQQALEPRRKRSRRLPGTSVREVELELRIAERHRLADGVVGFTLVDPEGRDLPPWRPGAHIDLLFGASLERQYSLCGDPADRSSWKVAILREPESRGGSDFAHEDVHAGSMLRVRGPRNHFELVPTESYLFIAGGIGITPIVPMIVEADAVGADWRLLYGGRTRDSMAFGDELAVYGEKVALRPEDEHGLLDLDAALGDAKDGSLVYCCGPERLLLAVEDRCAGWPAGSLHVERFAPRAPDPQAVAQPFEVVLDRSGLTLQVPVGKSILEVCLEAGVDLPSSCEEGTCGTCETEVLEGVPDHRDSVLSDQEREAADTMMVCVSRSLTGRLVLDL